MANDKVYASLNAFEAGFMDKATLLIELRTWTKKMKNEDLAFWLSWCIEEYAAKKNVSASKIAELFEKNDVFSYLTENAEILHTQGKNYILGSIEEFLGE